MFKCVILNYVGTTLYFFGNVLDIERLSIFKQSLIINYTTNSYDMKIFIPIRDVFVNKIISFIYTYRYLVYAF